MSEVTTRPYAGAIPPAASTSEEAAHPSLSSLSGSQLLTVLQAIASQMDTLNQLLIQAKTPGEAARAEVLIDAAQSICVLVGGMADHASGCGVYGDYDAWNYGQNFSGL